MDGTGDLAGTFGVLDHDFVVWFGDFNYRIIETVATERCFELAASGSEADLEQLRQASCGPSRHYAFIIIMATLIHVQRDQLNLERAAGRSFHGFTEGPLTFPPTYKYQRMDE